MHSCDSSARAVPGLAPPSPLSEIRPQLGGEGGQLLWVAVAIALPHLLAGEQPRDLGEVLTNARQYEAVLRAGEAVHRALAALEEGMTPDAVLTDAEEALAALGELDGRTLREDLVEAIFSRFCVGK